MKDDAFSRLAMLFLSLSGSRKLSNVEAADKPIRNPGNAV
jgi:hypothetical protein